MSVALSHRRPPCNRQGVLHDHEGEGKWRRVTGDLVAWPALGEAGMAVEVGGTGGAIGSIWREREIREWRPGRRGFRKRGGHARTVIFSFSSRSHNLAVAKAIICLFL
jgi:hypothetical protein